MKPDLQFSRCDASPGHGIRGWVGRWWTLVGFLLGALHGVPVVTGATVDPTVTVRVAVPVNGVWQLPGLLAVEVEVGHSVGAFGDVSQGWRLAPSGGWAGSVRLEVTDAAGQVVRWPFRQNAPRGGAPLELLPRQTALTAFTLRPVGTTFTVAAGQYQVRAVLESDSGDGWRGRVSSGPITLRVVPLPAATLQVEVATLVEGPAVAGWPWGLQVRLRYPQDAPRPGPNLAGGGRYWHTNLQWIVRGPDGSEVRRAWVGPELPDTGLAWLGPGESVPWVTFRWPAAETAGWAAGDYTVVARYARTAAGATDNFWSGVVESEPQTVRVIAPPEPMGVEDWSRRHRWWAEDALAEATSLQHRARSPGVRTEERPVLTRQAAGALVRAEAAAQRWLLLEPTSMPAALLLSRIASVRDDALEARAWAEAAMELETAGRTAVPGGESAPAIPDLRLLRWRQQLDAQPEVPDTALTPVLQLALDAFRGGPVPTNSAQLDEFIQLDPEGQWAAGARASSEYSTPNYSALRATGPPDVRFHGDNVNAWATRLADAPGEWIELTFARPVRAVGVRVRQSFNPGAISRVELFSVTGDPLVVFDGPDTNTYPAATIGWLQVGFPVTTQLVDRVRISLDSVRVRGWNEIDAVQLVAAPVTERFPPRLTLLPPAAGSREAVVAAWPEGFRLERSPAVEPARWTPFAERPPAVIPLGEAGAFFRLAEVPPAP